MAAPEPAADWPPALDIDGAVATVRLCRPSRANRIEADDIGVLRGHWRALSERAEVRALLITGTGKHFSAGYDIGAVLDEHAGDGTAGEPEAARTTRRAAPNVFAEMVDELEALPQVTVCALNGGVFGGSTDLALACDFRFGAPSTRMFMPAARLGLHYYPSGLRRFVSRLGLNAAKRLFLLAEELDAQTMLAIGYLDAIVPAEELMAHALRAAEAAAATAPLASRGMKAALNALAHGAWDAAAVAEAEAACLRSADLREGVAAWHEKRPPRFTGR